MVPILEARNVTKRFPGVLANDRCSFSLNEGEILAFLGENGAGKSTLMNILYGLYSQDEGEIEVRQNPEEINDPNDAIELGIGMVHQHFQLVPVFTVAENIVMGTEPTRFSFSLKTMGIAGGASALLFFAGGIFTLDNPLQWLLAGLAGGAAVAVLYGLFFLLGLLSRLGARVYLPVVGIVSVALLVVLALTVGPAERILLLIFLGLLFAVVSYPVLWTPTLSNSVRVRLTPRSPTCDAYPACQSQKNRSLTAWSDSTLKSVVQRQSTQALAPIQPLRSSGLTMRHSSNVPLPGID